MRRFLAWHRAWIAHDDPAAAIANLVAVVIAWNGPAYPIGVVVLTGRPGLVSLLTMAASPLFFAVPLLMRASSAAGRAALPLLGALDTLWSLKLFGTASGAGVFLLPALVLCALLFRRGERLLLLAVLGLVLAALFLPADLLGPPVAALDADDALRLARLNLVSAAFLGGLIALQFAGLLRRLVEGGL